MFFLLFYSFYFITILLTFYLLMPGEHQTFRPSRPKPTFAIFDPSDVVDLR